MDPDEAVVLTVVSSEGEADIVVSLLRTAGIESTYRDTEAIESPIEDFTESGPREILVREADLDSARGVISASST